MLQAGRDALRRALDADVMLQVGDHCLHADGLDDKDRAAADWAMRNRQPAGRYTDTLAGSQWWFLPLALGERETGVAALRLPSPTQRLRDEQRRLAEAMVEDIAQALVRTRLVADLEDARVGNETERLRSALLSSVSHDLRSPLASMIGSASSLDHYGDAMSAQDRRAAAGDDPHRRRTPGPVHPEPARHDAARPRRAHAQSRLDRRGRADRFGA